MKRLLSILAVTGLALAIAAPARAELAGGVTFATEYMLRGISQTNEEVAVQGNIDWVHGGFYVGIWGSNVDFGPAFPGAQIEFDQYFGYVWEFGSGFSLELGFIHYDYPGEDILNYEEYIVGVGFKGLGIKYWYADDFLGTGSEGGYLEGNYDIGLGGGLTLGLHAGLNTYDDNVAVGIENYTDYGVSLAKTFGNLEAKAAYIDTDENQLGNLDDERFVFSLTLSQ